jgi:hypothetical protein
MMNSMKPRVEVAIRNCLTYLSMHGAVIARPQQRNSLPSQTEKAPRRPLPKSPKLHKSVVYSTVLIRLGNPAFHSLTLWDKNKLRRRNANWACNGTGAYSMMMRKTTLYRIAGSQGGSLLVQDRQI